MMSLLLLEGVGPLHLQCMLEVAQTQVFSVPPTCQFIGESRCHIVDVKSNQLVSTESNIQRACLTYTSSSALITYKGLSVVCISWRKVYICKKLRHTYIYEM